MNNDSDININITVTEQIIEDKKWQVITVEDNGIGWVWDDMPVHVREKYLKARKFIESIGGKFSYTPVFKQGSKTVLMIPYRFALSKESIKKFTITWAQDKYRQLKQKEPVSKKKL